MSKVRPSLMLAGLWVALTPTAQATVESPHGPMKEACESCHTSTSFKDVEYDHGRTDFALDGRHATVKCAACHDIKNFAKAENRCSSCHLDVHEAKLGSDCARCHNASSWSVFDLDEIHKSTRYPMMGRHAQVDCQSCHPSMPQGDMASQTTRCVDCHQPDYLAVTSPNHVSAGFSTECTDCHQMNFWRPASMGDHDGLFPIFSGTHAGQWPECGTCHIDPSNNQVFTCLSCHEHEQPAMDSRHAGLTGYAWESHACYTCHPSGVAGNFTQHDQQYFPIYSGKHAGTWNDCSQCHSNPANRTDFNCLSCHEHSQPLMDPKHAGFPGYAWESNACLNCHPTGQTGQFSQHDASYFPIYSGKHAGTWVDCSTCHTNPANRAQVDCLSCHEHSQPLMDPVHQGMPGYAWQSTNCISCHPTGQKGNFVQHDALYFPIYTSHHAGTWADCNVCHTNPANHAEFNCLSCHEHSQPLMDPKHSGFPGYAWESNACLNCHPTGQTGQFTQHDATYFPIYSGNHAGTWVDCSVCHTNAANRAQVDCLPCHEHSQPLMDPVHQGMTGYAWQTAACLSCHPDGKKGQFVQHDAQFFPIYSSHHAGTWADCSTCHTNPANRAEFNCLTCHEHSQPLMDPVHQGMSGYAWQSVNCLSCHPTGAAGNFVDHDAQFFPIYSGRHNGTWNTCADCHTNPADHAVFTCFEGCHQHTASRTNSQHQGVNGYTYTSPACLNCHPNGRAG